MTQKTPYYVTTPLYYTSGKLHIGHAYTTVVADSIARYKRLRGYDVRFLTGTDEHGQKVQKQAEAAGKAPQQFVNELVDSIKSLWNILDINYDIFIRTTDAQHVQAVEKIFAKLYEQGDIYKSEYQGWYCMPCEAFWAERQLKEGNCPDCSREVQWVTEESYFFRLSKYQERLLKHIEQHPEFIQPASRRNEMVNNFLKPGLEDLCVSRTTFKWGIPVPFDKRHIIYVWIDALSNYITALGYDGGEQSTLPPYWPADLQLMGKEIVRFHTIIWPALLMALNLPLPKQVFGHGWLLFGDDKMSKSKGNVIDPEILVARYGSDSVRYYLLREVPFGSDGSYTEELFITRANADLANDLGNLLNRTVAMIERYYGGVLPEPSKATPFDESLQEQAARTAAEVEEAMDNLRFNGALESVFNLVKRANKYIDETAPWVLARSEEGKEQLATVLYRLADTLRLVGTLLQPFLPQTPCRIWGQLGLPAAEYTDWGTAHELNLIKPGARVVKGDAIFPRIDIKEALKVPEPAEAAPQLNPPLEAEIDFAHFSKVDLRVAEVLAAEKVPKADKLLKLRVSLGVEERTVVAGVAEHYEPASLVGRKIVLVANLAPAKIRGVESQGMILAASDDSGLAIISPTGDIKPGSRVK